MTDAEPKRICPESEPEMVVTDERGPNGCLTALIYADDFRRLPEYSCTMPTGVFWGKRWKRNMNFQQRPEPNWVIGGYDHHPDASQALIVWFDVMVVER